MPNSRATAPSFKRKALAAFAAFAAVVLVACAARSFSDKSAEEAAKAQAAVAGQQAESVLDDAQAAEVSGYGAAQADFARLLDGHTWTDGAGTSCEVHDGVARKTQEAGDASTFPLVVKSAEKSKDGSWKASVEVDGKSGVAEARQSQSGSWTLSCSALSARDLSSAPARADLEVDPLPAAIAESLGQERSKEIEEALAARISEEYPSATHASAGTTAVLDFEAGTVSMDYTLDNKASTKVSIKASLKEDGAYEIDGGR